MKVVIKYGKEHLPHADDYAEAEVINRFETHKKKGTSELVIETSTENIVLAARALFREGKLGSELLCEFQNIRTPVDCDGKLHWWPQGFCDINEKLLSRLCW